MVARFGRIGIENPNIRGLARKNLAKDVHDASWAQLTAMPDYRPASAGIELVRDDPLGTFTFRGTVTLKECPKCHVRSGRKISGEDTHRCECVLDRDLAAAKIVHYRAFVLRPGSGRGALSKRSGPRLAPDAFSRQ